MEIRISTFKAPKKDCIIYKNPKEKTVEHFGFGDMVYERRVTVIADFNLGILRKEQETLCKKHINNKEPHLFNGLFFNTSRDSAGRCGIFDKKEVKKEKTDDGSCYATCECGSKIKFSKLIQNEVDELPDILFNYHLTRKKKKEYDKYGIGPDICGEGHFRIYHSDLNVKNIKKIIREEKK